MTRHKSSTRWPNDLGVGWCCVRSTSCTWRRQEARVLQFSLKTGGDGLLVIWPQNHYNSFLVWDSKPMSMVWWFKPQNHCNGFFVWTSKLSGRRFVHLHLKTDERIKTVWAYASTSSGLFHREATQNRVSQFCLKTSGGAMTGDAHGIIVEVVRKWSKRWTVRWR
jgi:hypothetical protein